MIKKFKNFIIKILNLFGYRIVGIKKLVKHNNFDSIHQFLINTMAGNNQNIIIFDVGTNDGGSILRFKKIFEKSQIHCFEPTERLLNNIKDSFNLDNIKLNNIALGSQISERNFFFL